MGKTPSFEEIRNLQRANGPATILGLGTANPTNEICQSDIPSLYFMVNNAEHMTDLKAKFEHICKKTTIKKRYMYLTEELLKDNPHMCDNNTSSFDTRQQILATAVPELGKQAAIKAIKDWGQPQSKITHVIFCTIAGFAMPGADYELTKLLDLGPSVKRIMLYHQGCYGGGTVLRLAKDIAENNYGARLLVVCCEMTDVLGFQKPTNLDSVIGQALFADGAGAMIVGADPDESINERPIFQLLWASQTFIPACEGAVTGELRHGGFTFHISREVPKLISNNIEKQLNEAFKSIGINDWNSLFWIVHPGGPAILDEIEANLSLSKEKLSASRHVLSEFGNMSSATVFFVLDEMRKRSLNEGKATTGDGLDWGVLFGFGPGITIETIVLHSVPTEFHHE